MSAIKKVRTKVHNFVRGRVQKWGSARLKQKLWDGEFASGKWDEIENTSDDPIYEFIEKYCRKGSFLDLGCGSGNTGCELPTSAYQNYLGVDISEVALNRARHRSISLQRGDRNRYAQSDILTYVPCQNQDIILFRESIYYIPETKILGMLDRYARYLKPGGVFMVRCHNSATGEKLIGLIEPVFKILEKSSIPAPGPVIVVFNKGPEPARSLK